VRGKEFATYIGRLILEKKGEEVLIMDLKGLTSMADYFVICTANSDVQAKAIMKHVWDQLLFHSVKPWHVEGTSTFHWVLMDYIDVVLHIFQPDARDFYSLERLWGDAKITGLKEQNESTEIH
jgi:ribosome-associated protein